MENIIILILFTYPGAVADYLHSIMIRGKQYDKPAEGYFRTARDFFLSAVITLAVMAVFCPMRGVPFTLDGAAEAMRSGKGLWIFAALTLIGAVVTAFLWTKGNHWRLKVWNHQRARAGKWTMDENKSVWASMMKDKQIPFNNCALAFYKDGKLIKAGIPYQVSDDFQNDPWAILTWTGTAMEDLERPEGERSLLINPDHTFVNFGNGVHVDVYDGTEFRKFISSVVAGECAERSEQGEEVREPV